MGLLDELHDVDSDDREYKLALDLTRGDRKFMRDLISARIERGMSQKDVADALGIAQSSVAAFERYDNDPKLSTIRRYAQVVGVRIHRFVEPAWSSWGVDIAVPQASDAARVPQSVVHPGQFELVA